MNDMKSENDDGGTTMAWSRKASIVGIIICLFLSFQPFAFADERDTTWQIITSIDEILRKNPLPPGEKSQMVKIAEDDTVSIFLVRMMPGSELGPHFHTTHDETEQVIRGRGQLLVNDRWVEFQAGSFHFNPKGRVHGAKNTGDQPLVVLIFFTPAMRETDRHFLK